MILFISDLHLSQHNPETTRIFLDFLGGMARSADHLYILGDLFEAWPGDDCLDDPDEKFHADIVRGLFSLRASGTKLSVMHGNRDFLLGDQFATRSGATLIPDPYILSDASWQFVLSHGDMLCTDDLDYQAFRKITRACHWRTDFLNKPLQERKLIASALRQKSEDTKREKMRNASCTFDLNPRDTDDFLRQHGYATFIHGHTHRPMTHHHTVDGILVERWVLSDWHDDRGEVLCWDGKSLCRKTLL